MASIHTETLIYHDGPSELEAYVAYPSHTTRTHPCVLIAHAWAGRDSFACEKAKQLAALGYVGFAMDVYGKNIVGKNATENTRLMKPFIENRQSLMQRSCIAFETAQKLSIVDRNRIAVIGFCFGGLTALDMARAGLALKGVVSFHGLLDPPQNWSRQMIRAKVLALHGYDDPMVSPQVVMNFAAEMTAAHVDWQLHAFGGVKHAFMNPDAKDEAMGTVYHALSEKRAWLLMQNFLNEIFS